MDLQKLKNILKENGVVGAGGAGFPTYAKLSDKAKHIIINGAECEPLFSVDKSILRFEIKKVVKALNYLVDILGAENGCIALKEVYSDINEIVEKEVKSYEKINKKGLENFYPVGDEVVLIHECLGLVVPQGRIPLEVGVIVINVETALNVYNAMEGITPVVEKYLTIGGAIKNPRTIKVPVGTKFSDIFDENEEITIDDYGVLVGGPMTGRIGSLNESVTKTTKGVFILPKNNVIFSLRNYNSKVDIKRAMGICSQCRMCTDLCPRNQLGHSIEPHKIMNSISFSIDYEMDRYINSLACCECNICSSYACHQNLNPKEIISNLKSEMRKKGIKIEKNTAMVKKEREFRKLPVSRLINRLGLSKYNVKTPYENFNKEINLVVISNKQSIGACAQFNKKIGDFVKKGDVIGTCPENMLGVFLHSSIDGVVVDINDNEIIIRRG